VATNGVRVTPPQFAFGDEVIVVAGLSTGKRGRVVELTKIPFGSLQTYSVEFADVGLRVLRSDYIQRVAE
jgi:hypothetical protein